MRKSRIRSPMIWPPRMNEALKDSSCFSRCSPSRRSIARIASETTRATSNMVRALRIPAVSACWVRTPMTAWVPARLPELSNTSTRSPARSKTVILQNDAKSSTPAWVRESEPRMIPSSSSTPTQYVIPSRYSSNGWRASGRSGNHFVGPDPKGLQRVWSEGGRDRNVGGVATARDEDASDARGVVARIERVPGRPEVSLEPSREVHRRRVLRNADVAQVAGAIARRNVQAAAQGDRQVGEIAADALTFVESLPGGLGGSGELITERDVLVNEVADRLHPPPAERDVGKLVPSELGHLVGLAIAAPQEEDQRLLRQLRDGVLNGRRNDRLPLAAVVDGRVGGHPKMPRGGDQTRAPISKPISVGGRRDGRRGLHVVWSDEIRDPAVVHVQGQDHRRGLGYVVVELIAEANLHVVPRGGCGLRDETVHRHGQGQVGARVHEAQISEATGREAVASTAVIHRALVSPPSGRWRWRRGRSRSGRRIRWPRPRRRGFLRSERPARPPPRCRPRPHSCRRRARTDPRASRD